MIEADPSCKLVDEFLLWHGRRAPKKNFGEAMDEFIAAKKSNRGRSERNVVTLKKHLSRLDHLRARTFSDITPADLVLPANRTARTRRNIRAAWITLFRWGIENEFLPRGEKVAPERLEKPIVPRSIPTTYTPEQLEILLNNVRPDYLPWIACSNLAGIRTDELFPMSPDKSALDWSDFKWDQRIIVIRPETDKNGRRRVVPILPALKAWLWPVRKESGRMSPMCQPFSGVEPETQRLGALIGGWKVNAPRHSYISYRAAEVGIAKAAKEAGNSESEAKKSYDDAKSEADASRWFGVSPKSHSTKRPSDDAPERRDDD